MKYNYSVGIGATLGTALVVGVICRSIVKASEAKHDAKVEIAKAEAEKAKYEKQNNETK